MIEINTRDFGIIEVDESTVYEFPDGIYGFEEEKGFTVFEKPFEDISFLYLQSTKSLFPCFLVFEPWDLVTDYKPSISKEDMAALEVSDVEELILLVIAKVPSSIEELSLNIKSPIALNPKTMVGRQVILDNPHYPVRFMPFLLEGKEDANVSDK